jgi:hypothetical protein
MRLTKKLKEDAIAELLEILRSRPFGLPTSKLSGTPRFHGERTLSNRQIIRLLNASGRAQSHVAGYGSRTYYIWTLKPIEADKEAVTPVTTGPVERS